MPGEPGSWLAMVVGLAGGVALLLFGIDRLTSALRGVAGDSLRRLLAWSGSCRPVS